MARTASAATGGDEPPPEPHHQAGVQRPPKNDGDGGEEAGGGNVGVPAAAADEDPTAGAVGAAGRGSRRRKAGRRAAAPDEEDLDTILAEIDQNMASAALDSMPEMNLAQASASTAMDVAATVNDVGAEVKDDEMEAESAAAKRRKRKKEKEKERKTTSKVAEADAKKPPRHVRVMLEVLAKRKEAEELRKREEELRKRKAEEERLQREEDERMVEEMKMQQKERDKGKTMKKRQDGKTLTGKQKEEARRLDAMRRQFLGQSRILARSDLGNDGGANERKKRPIYDSKRKKVQSKADEAANGDGGHMQELHKVNKEEEECAIMEEQPHYRVEEDGEKIKLEEIKGAESVERINFEERITKEEKNEAMKSSNEEVVSLVTGWKNRIEEWDVDVDENDKDTRKLTPKRDPAKVDKAEKYTDLRSPICCILGHVDTGKTKLLDCIRCTNVQGGEAGGITQQIGATFFPIENIRERTKELKAGAALHVPGFLVIDTPGHQSFSNLRTRGSSLCDIAILVVDIMRGIQAQTIESLNILKRHKADFIIVLNKVDRLFGWKRCPNAPIKKALKQQAEGVKMEFDARLTDCTVLEVKVTEGHCTTIDVVLANGFLREGDQIVTCGMQGPIVTHIRALLTPHPMKELRIKCPYQHHKEIKASQGIKISAPGLEHSVAGTSLFVVQPGDDQEKSVNKAMAEMVVLMNRIDKNSDALIEFLKSPAVNIPIYDFNIGPVHRKDVMKASVMLEKKKEYAAIFAFDVKVMPDAREIANESGVKIFVADVIYHLFDQFTTYIEGLREIEKDEKIVEAVFPCVLKIIPDYVFNLKDPIVLGVDVLEGVAKVGTPLCLPSNGFARIGNIASIQNSSKQVDVARKGEKVAIKNIVLGVFDRSQEALQMSKRNVSGDLTLKEWELVRTLKHIFRIP
uniref:Eukaryotic translation initiation factor 5B n=1 Tax=Oryza rufipogon TaxID=4529 RepID=A0A0E0MYI9_ORYRU